jgi:hypothetical protein
MKYVTKKRKVITDLCKFNQFNFWFKAASIFMYNFTSKLIL